MEKGREGKAREGGRPGKRKRRERMRSEGTKDKERNIEIEGSSYYLAGLPWFGLGWLGRS